MANLGACNLGKSIRLIISLAVFCITACHLDQEKAPNTADPKVISPARQEKEKLIEVTWTIDNILLKLEPESVKSPVFFKTLFNPGRIVVEVGILNANEATQRVAMMGYLQILAAIRGEGFVMNRGIQDKKIEKGDILFGIPGESFGIRNTSLESPMIFLRVRETISKSSTERNAEFALIGDLRKNVQKPKNHRYGSSYYEFGEEGSFCGVLVNIEKNYRKKLKEMSIFLVLSGKGLVIVENRETMKISAGRMVVIRPSEIVMFMSEKRSQLNLLEIPICR